VHVPNPSDAASKIRLTPLFLLGWVSALIGVIIRYHCYSAMGTLFTFDLSIRKDHKLITSGPYSIVRHPGYSGSIFAVVGVVITHLSNGSWVMECSGLMWWVLESIWIAAVLALLPLIGPRSKKEDNMLKKEFGKQWEEWAMNVPYRLFPGIY
jgi:protein-S-isoprenylcysteine O-methyltransferase Ste14